MNVPLEQLLAALRRALEPEPSVHAAFLFGSVLASDSPNDIDILLVYDPGGLDSARSAREEVTSLVENCCGGRPAHITMMSSSELNNSRILSKVEHRSIL